MLAGEEKEGTATVAGEPTSPDLTNHKDDTPNGTPATQPQPNGHTNHHHRHHQHKESRNGVTVLGSVKDILEEGAEHNDAIPDSSEHSTTTSGSATTPASTSPLKSNSDPSIPASNADDDDNNEDKDVAKESRRNRRRFVVNQRGFMGVQSMVTAKLVDEYQLLQVLGQGFYGKVYLGTSVAKSNGETVAIKQLDERKFQKEQFDSISAEFHTLHRIIHPNIISYKRILLDENTIYVATEFVDNGSIYDAILKSGPLPELTIARYVKQILNGLAHLQDLKIVHRNLKCSNILLTKNGECKITDFELSHKHESNRYTIRGAPYWMAPEVIEMAAPPTCAADIWGLGCMIIEMLTGEPPYRNLGPMSALLSISRDVHPPLPNNISEYLRHFLGHCFAKDPEIRHDAKTLKKHPWVMQIQDGTRTPTGPPSPNHPLALPGRLPTSNHAPTPTENHTAPSHPPTSSAPPASNPSPSSSAPVSISPTHSPSASPNGTSPISASSHSPPHPATALSPPSQPSTSTARATTPPPPSASPTASSSPPEKNFGLIHSPSSSSPLSQAHPHATMQLEGHSILIDVYSEKDKEDFDLLEMTSKKENRDTPASVEEEFQFEKSAFFLTTPGQSEVDALKAEIEYLRELNDKNVEQALLLKDRFEKNLEVQQRLIDLAWRLRERSDMAMDNIKQAAKATAHSNMLLKRTNQVATEALAHGAIVTSNTRKLEEYILEGDPAGKKLMNIVFKKNVSVDSIVNPTMAGWLLYNTHLKTWKKDKEKRAWFVLKDNFLFAFKNDKGSTAPNEVVYLGEGARLLPMSEDQCKKKFCFRLGEIFLLATETAEMCSEWMLALSRPQKWYESSYGEDNLASPRSGSAPRKEDSTSTPPTPSLIPESPSQSNISSPALSSPAALTPSNSNKGSKGKRASGYYLASPPLNNSPPVFGVSIDELFAREGGNVPYFYSRIIQYLEEKGLQEEGILRISGSLSEINSLKEALQHGEDVDFSSHDPHAVAGLLKAFFRELPTPIIPDPYHSRILEVMFNQEMMEDQRVVEVKMILDQLPAENRALLKVLMSFLVKVNCNADKNKMTIQNLITCMVPTLKCVPGVFMYVIPNYDFVFDVE